MLESGAMEANDFDPYLDHLTPALAPADGVSGLKDYCTGLMLPLQRKSVESLAAHLDPLHVSAKHQAMVHFVGQSDWSDDAMLDRVLD
jgi:SRSO17 transposase